MVPKTVHNNFKMRPKTLAYVTLSLLNKDDVMSKGVYKIFASNANMQTPCQTTNSKYV